MEPREPRPPDEGASDALRELQERLGRASDAAERLISEAAGKAGKPPPAGWQWPEADEPRGPDLEVLVALVESLRELVPEDLQRRLADALRELLLALRALIDWYVERLDRRRPAPSEVQDIPIL